MRAAHAVIGAALLVAGLGTATAAFSETIPGWARSTALYWGQGEIGDDEFISFLQYMIDRGVITVPGTAVEEDLRAQLAEARAELEELRAAVAAGKSDGQPGRGDGGSGKPAGTEHGGTGVQGPKATVSTDKGSYGRGETVLISGTVGELLAGAPVSVTIRGPDGSVALALQADVRHDMTFALEHLADMADSGEYSVTASYGNAGLAAGTAFEYDAGQEAAEYPTTYAGTFVGVNDGIHNAEGDAFTVPLEDGGTVLRLENFRATNGPDLYVYLSTDKRASDIVNLGQLKANRGNQNYEIPEGTDLDKYNRVLIWCKPFHVLFGSAEILPQP